MLSVVFALMLLVILSIVVAPLLRQTAEAQPSRLAGDLAVYRDQLAEVKNEAALGLIAAGEADAARQEIIRRVALAEREDKKMRESQSGSNRALAIVLAVFLPLVAVVGYGFLGNPNIASRPFADRQHDPEFVVAREVARLQEQMQQNPSAEGFARLGDLNYALKRFDQAASAYHQALKLHPRDVALWSELGEALSFGDDGAVGPEARHAFMQALKIDARDARSRFFMGVAAAEDGQARDAIAIWRDLEKDSPPDAPWLGTLRKHMAEIAEAEKIDPASVRPHPPVLGSAAPKNSGVVLQPDAQDAFIHAMVDRLADKLKKNPDDLEGWRRLERSYRVLGETAKADEAHRHVEALQNGKDKP